MCYYFFKNSITSQLGIFPVDVAEYFIFLYFMIRYSKKENKVVSKNDIFIPPFMIPSV